LHLLEKKNETQNQKETTEIKSGPSTHKLWREREDDKRRETHNATGRGRGRGSQHPAASMDRQHKKLARYSFGWDSLYLLHANNREMAA
jgi:hypothetical protein